MNELLKAWGKAALFIIGFEIVGSAFWIMFDWITGLINFITVTMNPEFCQHWSFWLPLDIWSFNCQDWTVPFDLSLLVMGVGFSLVFAATLIKSKGSWN